jgi:DNA-binding winged helix-turn-helix (wHTH) protein
MVASYILGPFRLDAETDTLFRSGEPVSLGRRAVALLRVLVEQRGFPVSKDALMDAAWPGLTVGESNLAVQIAALRRVLGEEPGGDNWIETLPRRGYRFVGPASARDQGAVTAASQAANFPVAVGSSNPASGPPPRTPERRHITALAAELAPAPGGRLPADPEDLAAIVGGFRGQASDALTRHGGVIGESRGREILAYFGYPTAHENDAERAVRAALAIQRGLAQHNVENAGKDAPELSARIGLECGLVVVDSTGEMIGDAANVASRVQTAAEPGSVLVTANVLRQVPGARRNAAAATGGDGLLDTRGRAVAFLPFHRQTRLDTSDRFALGHS